MHVPLTVPNHSTIVAVAPAFAHCLPLPWLPLAFDVFEPLVFPRLEGAGGWSVGVGGLGDRGVSFERLEESELWSRIGGVQN